MPEELKKLVR